MKQSSQMFDDCWSGVMGTGGLNIGFYFNVCLRISIIKGKNQNRSFLWVNNFLESIVYDNLYPSNSCLKYIFMYIIYILLLWRVNKAV